MGKYTPMVLIEEDNGEYRILENEIFGQWVLPSKAKKIAEGVLRFYEKYSDEDIENSLPMSPASISTACWQTRRLMRSSPPKAWAW